VCVSVRVCTAPGSPARGPRSPFAVSRPPNYLPLRSELNESRRVTVAIRRVSPPRQSPPDGAGGGRREGRKRTIASDETSETGDGEERAEGKRGYGGREGDWAGGGGGGGRKSWPSFIRLFSLPEMAEFNPELGLASSPQITP